MQDNRRYSASRLLRDANAMQKVLAHEHLLVQKDCFVMPYCILIFRP